MKKRSMWKKTVSFLLTAAMLLTAVPVSAAGFDGEEIKAAAQDESGFQEEYLPESEDFQEEAVPEEEEFQREAAPEDTEALGEGTANTEGKAAEIGLTEYDTLAEAIAAAGTNAEIKLLRDVTESVFINSSQTVHLNLNGKTLTNAADNQTITNEGTLTIKGSGVVDNVSHGCAAVWNNPTGIVTLAGGTYTRSQEKGITAEDNGGNSYYTLVNHGKMTIQSGVTVSAENGKYTSLVENGWFSAAADSNAPEMIIKGGEFSGGKYTIKNDEKGKLTIKDGTFRNTDMPTVLNWNEATIEGGEFYSDLYAVITGYYHAANGKGQTTITGGTYTTGADPIAVFAEYSKGAVVSVSGGVYNREFLAKYIAEGYGLKAEPGRFEVIPCAASADGVPYSTLMDAIRGANGKTITLEKDWTEDVVILADQSVNLDLNGHKLTNTGNSAAHTITNNGYLDIMDSVGTGVVDNISHGCAALQNNAPGTAVLDGGTYTRSLENGSSITESGGNSFYNLRNYGRMTINDGVTVSQTGHFSSLVANGWYNGNDNKGGENAVLDIYGGSFSGGINTIKNDDWGELRITAGSFTNTTQAAVLNVNVAVIDGGSFESSGAVIITGRLNDTMDKGELAITGGDFVANGSRPIIEIYNGAANGTIEVSGGSYNKALQEDYVLPGYKQNASNEVEETSHLVTFVLIGDASLLELPEAPKEQHIGHNMIMPAPAFSHAGYTVDGWYTDVSCSAEYKWNFAEKKVKEAITLYAKAAATTDTIVGEAVKAAIDGFTTHCSSLAEGNALKGKTLADMTAAALQDADIISALKEDATKAELKKILDTLDKSVSPTDLESYLSRNQEQKVLIGNLRAIQDIVFAVEALPAPVQSEVTEADIAAPPVPIGVPEEKKTEIEEAIKKQREAAVMQIIAAVTDNDAVNQRPAEGLEESAKGAVTEPSVLFVEAKLIDMALDAVVEADSQGDYKVSLVPKKVVFEVSPYKQKAKVNDAGEIIGADKGAAPAVIPNEDINQPVIFYLPIPDTVTENYARITHDGKDIGSYPIQGTGYNRYVLVKVNKFSKFELEFTNDSGYHPAPVTAYTVKFDAQGGSAVASVSGIQPGTVIPMPAAPVKDGYDFGGWYKDAACTAVWDFASDKVTADITLFAKWIEKEPESQGPAPVTVKVESKTTDTVRISWTESKGAGGYTLWTRAEGENKYTRKAIISGDKARTYTWKNRKPGTKYYFVVKAWVKDEAGKYVFSEASKTVRATMRPEAAKIKKAVIDDAGNLKIYLAGKAEGANRYAMCWSREADFSSYRIGIRTQYTTRTAAKGLKAGTYYVRVRSYRQLTGTRVYGDWGEVVKVVKK